MLLDEIYNPRVFSRGFEKEQSHGPYRLVAKHGQLPWLGHGKVPMTSDQFRIEAYLGRNMVGWVNFEVVDDHLEAIDVVVDKKHRRKGIGTAMYQFAKSLGNDISPSSKQTGMGREFWATKSPVVEDLTQGRNLNDETAAYVKNHQWKLTTVNPKDLDVDGFDDPYGRVIDIDPDHPVNFKDPIIVDANGIIIDGFHRAYQAQRQGLKKIPAYVPVQGVAEGQEHVDHDLMDSLMVKLCEMVIDGQKSPEDMGWVAAAVLDPNNNCVAAVNYALPSGKRVHGERAAIDAYLRRFGDIPSGSTIITTLSPCSEDMEERYSESCTDLLEQHGIKKVYAGYQDPTQDQDSNIDVTITENPRVKELCRAFAETFLPAKLDELSFLGSQCTKDCSGHRAGYAWYKQKQRQPNSWSPSFNKGAALAQAGK